MDLQTMVGRVRKTLGEPEPNGYGTQSAGTGTWDNSQIIGYLNEALGILAHDWRKEASTTTAFTSVNQTDVALPNDCLEDGLRATVYVNSGNEYPMEFVDLSTYQRRAIDASSVSGLFPVDRRLYTVWGGMVKIYPGAASTSDSLKFYYFRAPASLSAATDIPEIPERFHVALVYYALKECQNAVEETNLELDVAQKWEQERIRFRMEMARNQRDRGIVVRGRR